MDPMKIVHFLMGLGTGIKWTYELDYGPSSPVEDVGVGVEDGRPWIQAKFQQDGDNQILRWDWAPVHGPETITFNNAQMGSPDHRFNVAYHFPDTTDYILYFMFNKSDGTKVVYRFNGEHHAIE